MPIIEDTIDTAFNTAGRAATGTGKALLNVAGKIFSGVQAANKYRRTTAASGHNRSVFIAPYLSRNDLLLNDDPAYDDVGIMNVSAHDYIYGDEGTAEKLIVSGGTDRDRSKALAQFVLHSHEQGMPLFVIADSNRELVNMIRSITGNAEVISADTLSGDSCFHVFGGMRTNDIVHILIDAIQERAEKGWESLLFAIVETLIKHNGTLSVHSLASYPLTNLQGDIDSLYRDKRITKTEHEDLSDYCKAGSSSRASLRLFIEDLGLEFHSVFGKPSGRNSNVKAMLAKHGAVILNIGNGMHKNVVNLIHSFMKLLLMKGMNFNILLDNFPIHKYPDFMDILRGTNYSAAHTDFIASMAGDCNEALFSELTSGSITVLFWNTGKSAVKWSEYLGNYSKIKTKTAIAQSGSIFDFRPSKSVSEEEHDKPRISPAALSRLPASTACILRHHEILIAAI